VNLEQRSRLDEIADEPDSGQEEVGLERRDVRAVPDTRLEDANECERPNCFPQ
jgi:hypothetical protein